MEEIECSCSRPIDDPDERSALHIDAASWKQPGRCLAPGGDGDGCTRIRGVCPLFCDDCSSPVPDSTQQQNNLSATQFFRHTGYYLKQLDASNALGLRDAEVYVIVLNTNLGAANDPQTRAFEKDLAWVAARRGSVYILGHHPGVMSNPSLVPTQYQHLVLGTFAGHVHWAGNTTDLGFTQISSISQAGETSFATQTIGTLQGMSMKIDIRLGRDVVSWNGDPGSSSTPSMWYVRHPKDSADLGDTKAGLGARRAMSTSTLLLLFTLVVCASFLVWILLQRRQRISIADGSKEHEPTIYSCENNPTATT
jgi:hypothetical protein